ncbi:sigma-54 interaction domain-containing protein, partial [Bacteroidota bacterium]
AISSRKIVPPFCDDRKFSDSKLRYPREFQRKNGEIRNLEMTVVTINPPNSKVTGALVIFRDLSEVVHLRKRLEHSRGFNGIIGRHVSMTKVFNTIHELADVKVPILIQGETGTGKEMVATALHQLSKRASGPFVPVNCGALPEGTLESELFGHVKGAFTGAIRDRKGRFELAKGGTIFLDEIAEVSPSMQVKLLRVLQENNFVPVGGEKNIKVNARVICATNKDLKLLTQQGLFREDLYYRLAVVPVNLPSLREKKSDINLLIEYFLDKYSTDIGKRVREISPEALSILMKYNWPGNVRELSNAVQYGMIKCNNGKGILEHEHLPPEILDFVNRNMPSRLGRPVKIDTEAVQETLALTGGNKAKAAKLLSVSRTTLYRIINQEDM